jgi:calcineurin-like phosphoesterase
LPGGTAYLTDAGMCGVFDSVIGMEKDEPVNRFVTRMNSGRFVPRTSERGGICGVAVEIDGATGLATAISPVRLGADIRNVEPDFWMSPSQLSS